MKKAKKPRKGLQDYPAKTPDLDNLEKSWNDSANGVLFVDDALIVDGFSRKRYGRPGIFFRLYEPRLEINCPQAST